MFQFKKKTREKTPSLSQSSCTTRAQDANVSKEIRVVRKDKVKVKHTLSKEAPARGKVYTKESRVSCIKRGVHMGEASMRGKRRQDSGKIEEGVKVGSSGYAMK